MLKVSKLNPKDTTLDEIHSIQAKSYEQQREWTFKHIKSHYNKVIKKVSSEFGITFQAASNRLRKKR